MYLKTGPKLWRQQRLSSSLVDRFANRWIRGSTRNGGVFAGFGAQFDLRGFMSSFRSSHGKLRVVGRTRIGERPAVGVKDESVGTVYVSTVGKPYFLSAQVAGSGGGTLSFEDWNRPLTVRAPADFLDFDALTGHKP